MIAWIAGGALVSLALAASTIAICKAAGRADRQLHHPPLDADEQAWAELVARLAGPTTWCATCGQPTTDNRLWCDATCQTVWETP